MAYRPYILPDLAHTGNYIYHEWPNDRDDPNPSILGFQEARLETGVPRRLRIDKEIATQMRGRALP